MIGSFRVAAALAAAALLLSGFPRPSEGRPERAGTQGAASRGAVNDNTVLGDVNGETIRVSQLREWMRKTDIRHTRSFLGDTKAREGAFRELVNERLVVQYMRAAGKANSEEYRARVGAKRTILLANLYLAAYSKEYVPPDNEVRALLPPVVSDLDLRIFFGESFSGTADTREEVVGGKDMEALVRERSVGPGAEKGGLIRGFKSNTYIPAHIEKGAFSSGKGWVSPVFETPLGYAFFRVEEAREIPPEKIREAAEASMVSLRAAAGERMVREASQRAVISIDNAVALRLDALPASEWAAQFQETVAEVDGKKVGVRDLYWYVFEGRNRVFPRPGSGEVPELARSFSAYLVVAGEAAGKGLDRTPPFENGIRRFSDRILLDMFREETARSVTVSDKEAREFFRRNREALKRPEGRFVREVQAKDEVMARTLFAQFKADPREIERFAAGTGGGAGKGQILYKGRMNGEDEKLVFGAPVGELTGPYPKGGVWVMFIVDREVPKVDDPSFEDYAAEAKEFAREEKVATVIREKVEGLYRKAAVTTYSEVLDSVQW